MVSTNSTPPVHPGPVDGGKVCVQADPLAQQQIRCLEVTRNVLAGNYSCRADLLNQVFLFEGLVSKTPKQLVRAACLAALEYGAALGPCCL